MSRAKGLFLTVCCLSFLTSGCLVRKYTVIKERVDQDLESGNRGYLTGKPANLETKPQKTGRKMKVIEIELPLKDEASKEKKPRVSKVETQASVYVPPIIEEVKLSLPVSSSKTKAVASVSDSVESKVVIMKEYQVLNGDTLQRISKKFYGTTKRWKDIFDVNQANLKGPDKIYPGQVIEIPIEEIEGIAVK